MKSDSHVPANADPADPDRHIAEVKSAYIRRDNQGPSPIYRFTNPAYLFHFQDLEWEMMSELRRAGLDLSRCSVLEVGTGVGHILHRLKAYGAQRAVGMDLLESRIQDARRIHPTVDFVVGDAAQMPFADETFDLVIQFTCFSSVTDRSVRVRIAREMWRVLASGGAVLSYDFRPRPLYDRWMQRRAGPMPEGVVGTARIPPGDIAAMFPEGKASYRKVGIDFQLAGHAARSRLAVTALRGLPLLQPYALVTIRKRS